VLQLHIVWAVLLPVEQLVLWIAGATVKYLMQLMNPLDYYLCRWSGMKRVLVNHLGPDLQSALQEGSRE
jgi:hypothetical protein